MHKRDALKEY